MLEKLGFCEVASCLAGTESVYDRRRNMTIKMISVACNFPSMSVSTFTISYQSYKKIFIGIFFYVNIYAVVFPRST